MSAWTFINRLASAIPNALAADELNLFLRGLRLVGKKSDGSVVALGNVWTVGAAVPTASAEDGDHYWRTSSPPEVYVRQAGAWVLLFTLTAYTDEQAQDAAALLLTTATHAGVSVSYDDAAGRLVITNTDTGSAARTAHEAAFNHANFLTTAQLGAANGVATLGSDQKVPAAQLPSYVDDVLEFANLAAFPGTGEGGKIYVAADTGKAYRWSGSIYIEISASPGSTDAVTEGSTNLYFTAQRVRDVVLTGLSLATNAAITAADSVLGALGKLQKQITDDIAALASHIGNTSNPHSTTAAQVGADPAGTAASALAGHVAAADPHTQYQRKLPSMSLTAASATISTTATTVASLTLTANTLAQGAVVDAALSISTLINTTAASNLVIDLLVNGAVAATTTVALGTTAVPSPGRGAKWKGALTFRAVGASGSVIGDGDVDVNNLGNFCSNVTAPLTVNTTADVTVALRVATSAATSNCVVQQGHIKRSI